MSRPHPLEIDLNASADDILTAVSRGRMTIVDVKGKLAELFLDRRVQLLVQQGLLDEARQNDRSGEPDFTIRRGSRVIRMECKNARRGDIPRKFAPATCWAEIQRTRNSKDGTLTRAYSVDEFDVLAVCLFNQTGKWDFVFAPTAVLARRPTNLSLLAVQQPVITTIEGGWCPDLIDVLGRLSL